MSTDNSCSPCAACGMWQPTPHECRGKLDTWRCPECPDVFTGSWPDFSVHMKAHRYVLDAQTSSFVPGPDVEILRAIKALEWKVDDLAAMVRRWVGPR
jgi:hypothetical protein